MSEDRKVVKNGGAPAGLKRQMWRYQISAQVIAKHVPSFIEYPPMLAGASFNAGDLKEKIEVAMRAAQAHNQ
jgi:hypothetical protein